MAQHDKIYCYNLTHKLKIPLQATAKSDHVAIYFVNSGCGYAYILGMFWLSRFSEIEHWNGILEWNAGID